jgi:hypothetical protein
MTVRDLIEDALERLDADDGLWLIALVRPGDERFREVTDETIDDPLGTFYRHDGQWWWYRVPKVPGALRPNVG